MMAAAFTLNSTAQQADPNVAKAERMFGFVLEDKADSLYANMADEVKAMVPKEKLSGILMQVEATAGKYKSHSAWEVQTVMGTKAYVSMVQFERAELGALVVFGDNGKTLGLQLIPSEMVKKN